MKGQAFDALMLSCVSADPEVSHADVYVTYPFQALPEAVRTGLEAESITNGELEKATLGLPDGTIQRVMWRVSSERGTAGATVGYEAPDAPDGAPAFGIRSRSPNEQTGEGPELVLPGDAGFLHSVEQVTTLATEVEQSFSGPH